MIKKTPHTVNLDDVQKALYSLPESLLKEDGERYALNKPTGDFFYDPWVLKEEFVGTVWETIYNSLAVADKGEARIIRLNGGSNYISHADMDDRYHLNLSGVNCFLIDLETQKFYNTEADGIWYDMDAGKLHTAANFGNRVRFQIVVRKLLEQNYISNPVSITITPKAHIDPNDARYIFDEKISPWLNRANKDGKINRFNISKGAVSFVIDRECLEDLVNMPLDFEVDIK